MQTNTLEPKIRILLVDDHILMRMGLASAANNEPDMLVVAEAEDGEEAIEAYRRERPDLVILDLRMPKKNGLQTIVALRGEFPAVRILVLSNYGGGDDVSRALKAGASGFLVKDMPLENLLEAVRCIHAGGQYVPPEVARKLAGLLVSQLTNREMEVLSLIGKGQSNKEIASSLNLVEGTVKLHVTSILSKLGVADRTQAVLVAMKRGILQLE